MRDVTHWLIETEAKLGYRFCDKTLLQQALTHSSYFNECPDTAIQHNERLEFLGDAVLGLIISDYLYRHLPHVEEGELSRLRALLVEASHCAHMLRMLNLEEHILLGKGERASQGRGRETILADLFEAIVGAIYLDAGMETVRHFLWAKFAEDIERTLAEPRRNWKTELQEYVQKKYQVAPEYLVLHEEGPEHDKRFVITVSVQGEELGRGVGTSKKGGEQMAAQRAVELLLSREQCT